MKDDNDPGRFPSGQMSEFPSMSGVNESRAINTAFLLFSGCWTQFAELRYGYRSADYPFGVIELMIDERTGKGEGTYIAAGIR